MLSNTRERFRSVHISRQSVSVASVYAIVANFYFDLNEMFQFVLQDFTDIDVKHETES